MCLISNLNILCTGVKRSTNDLIADSSKYGTQPITVTDPSIKNTIVNHPANIDGHHIPYTEVKTNGFDQIHTVLSGSTTTQQSQPVPAPRTRLSQSNSFSDQNSDTSPEGNKQHSQQNGTSTSSKFEDIETQVCIITIYFLFFSFFKLHIINSLAFHKNKTLNEEKIL